MSPELKPPESVCPLCWSALIVNGKPLGNDVAPPISVAVCAKPSLLMNRIVEPTGTSATRGAYPPPVPAGVEPGPWFVRLTSTTRAAVVPPPVVADSAPGVQADKTAQSARSAYLTAAT